MTQFRFTSCIEHLTRLLPKTEEDTKLTIEGVLRDLKKDQQEMRLYTVVASQRVLAREKILVGLLENLLEKPEDPEIRAKCWRVIQTIDQDQDKIEAWIKEQDAPIRAFIEETVK